MVTEFIDSSGLNVGGKIGAILRARVGGVRAEWVKRSPLTLGRLVKTLLTAHEPKWTINRMSKKRLKFQDCVGTKGEKLTVSWMPDNCVRLTFRNCGKTVVTKVFPAKLTNIEVSYNG
jgi:hypothetical protein